jgi:hypothetical protein
MERVRNARRTTKLQHTQLDKDRYAPQYFQMMKAALRSEFAGDLITARAWIAAISLAETNGCSSVGTLRAFSSPEVAAIWRSIKDSDEECPKRLWEALVLARKLNWRSSALS